MFLQNESILLLTPSPGTSADAPSVLASRDPAEGQLASAGIGLTRTKAPCSANTRHGDRRALRNAILFWLRVFIKEVLTEVLS